MAANDMEQRTEKQLVIFTLASEEFGVEINQVREIIKPRDMTRLPHTPPYIKGVINLRGEIIPVIDLRKRFSVDSGEMNRDTRIIIVEMDENRAGLLVDAVTEVLRLASTDIEATPRSIAGLQADFIQGVGKMEDRLLILLDVKKILSSEEEIQLQAQVEQLKEA
ncbi:MAG: chemotaxis protein CheW [Limnochordia bacterium]